MDRWLEHLPDDDLALLGRATGRRAGPGQVEVLLADPAAYQAVFTPRGDPLLRASPFLVFALAVHQTAANLEAASFVPEWSGRQGRVAVFDAHALRRFLAGPARRLFLAELLASYVHVASGSVWVRTDRGWRRRRYSELDPVRLATLLEVVDEAERPGAWRRLGDLALFLTGMFPDHTDARRLGSVQAGRLLRSAGLGPAGPAPAGPAPAVGWRCWSCWAGAGTGWPPPAPRAWRWWTRWLTASRRLGGC
jgi:hypothetical protein